MSKQVFDQLRTMSGGKLSQTQVDAGNLVLQSVPDNVLLAMLGAPDKQNMTISQAGIDMICAFEGYRDYAYDDGVGVMTIGYGTTVYPNGAKVRRGDRVTQEQAKAYMQHDLAGFERAVNDAVTVSLNQNQFDALVSFTYNVGIAAFKSSTLVKKVNAGDKLAAANQFLLWNKARGKVLQGLVNRRSKERALFLS